MKGKERCKILREIRQKIATDNNISLITNECSYKGECKGTCPKCEAEVRYLERELEKKRRMGQFITIAGLAVGSALGLASCDDSATEGDVAPMPSYYSDTISARENAQREVIYRNIMDYADEHPVYLTDTTGLSGHAVPLSFTVTPDGKITNIKASEDHQIATTYVDFIKELPHEILTGLTQNCTYILYLYFEDKKIIILR